MERNASRADDIKLGSAPIDNTIEFYEGSIIVFVGVADLWLLLVDKVAG